MVDVFSLAQEIQAEFYKQKVEIDNLKKGLDLRMARVKKAERDAQEKNVQLADWEKVLNKKYEEVSRMENAKFLELRAQQDNVKAEEQRKDALRISEETEKMLMEVKQRQTEVQAREVAVTEREKDYRQKIKREVADKMAETYLGIK